MKITELLDERQETTMRLLRPPSLAEQYPRIPEDRELLVAILLNQAVIMESLRDEREKAGYVE